MSYTSDNQLLRPSLDKILEGIEEFDRVAGERIKSGVYVTSHENELTEFRREMADLYTRLTRFSRKVR